MNTYFAPLPAYTRLYLESCRRNPEVQFLFVSDQPRPDRLPSNVEWRRMTVAALAARVERALGVRVSLSASIKVCDVRPAFGLVFADELAGFSHWAYSDVDLLWGRIRPLLDRHAAGADVLSFRDGWLSGTFTVFRNTDATARLFLLAPDALNTLASPCHHDFDESCGRWDRPRRLSELRCAGLRTSFWDVLHEAESRGRIRWAHPDLLSEPHPRQRTFDLEWTHGRLTDLASGEERIAYHLLDAKDAPLFRIPEWAELPARIHISEAGIRDCERGQIRLRLTRGAIASARYARSAACRARQVVRAEIWELARRVQERAHGIEGAFRDSRAG